MRRGWCFIAALVVLATTGSCSDDSGKQQGECARDSDCGAGKYCSAGKCETTQVELADRTRVLERDPLFESVVVGASSLDFTFKDDASKAGLKAGDILVGTASGGYLRRATSVTLDGKKAHVETTDAALTDAVKNAQFKVILKSEGAELSGTTGQSLKQKLMVTVPLDGTELSTSGDFQVKISKGSISFGPTVDLELKIVNGAVEVFQASATGQAGIDLNLSASATTKLVSKSSEIKVAGPTQWALGCIMVGPLPVCADVELSFYVGSTASISAATSLTAGFDCSTSITAGARYEDGAWKTLWSPTGSCHGHPLEVTSKATVKTDVYVKPDIKVLLYKTTGPGISVKGYLEISGTRDECEAKLGAKAGLSGDLTYDLEILSKSIIKFNSPLFKWEVDLGGLQESWCEAGLPDAGLDAGKDAGSDTLADAALDAPVDAQWDAIDDAPADAAKDAPLDAKDDTQADVTKTDTFSTPGFVSIPAGTFVMGSPASEPCRGSNEDQHQVTLTHGFEISDHETTQGEFQALMGYNPSGFTSCGASCPVEWVTWYEAAAYCNALSAQKGLTACYDCTGSDAGVSCTESTSYSGSKIYDCPGYRLPTDAEREYAHRAGTTTAYYNGANDPAKCMACSDANADAISWYKCNSGSTTHPVKQKPANAWGLYDMAGNVWEWCHDWYQANLGSSAVVDPVVGSGSLRAVRGGNWNSTAGGMRTAFRGGYGPTLLLNRIGLRCSRTQ